MVCEHEMVAGKFFFGECGTHVYIQTQMLVVGAGRDSGKQIWVNVVLVLFLLFLHGVSISTCGSKEDSGNSTRTDSKNIIKVEFTPAPRS